VGFGAGFLYFKFFSENGIGVPGSQLWLHMLNTAQEEDKLLYVSDPLVLGSYAQVTDGGRYILSRFFRVVPVALLVPPPHLLLLANRWNLRVELRVRGAMSG
jgi:hypothetical protein